VGGELDDLLVANPAGGREDHSRGHEVAGKVGVEVIRGNCPDGLRCAVDGAGQRVVLSPQRLQKSIPDHPLRVGRPFDFMEEDLPLPGQTVAADVQGGQRLTERAKHAGEIFRQHDRLQGGVLAVG